MTASLRPNPTLQNDTTSASVGIYQEFEIGGKRSARIKSAELATQISQRDAEDTRRVLTLNLRQAFVSVFAGEVQHNLQFARDNLSNYQRTVDFNTEMLKQGAISRADFLKIQLEMLQFQTDLDDATLELKTAKASLRGMLGSGNVPMTLTYSELKAVPFEKDLPELKKLALQNRPGRRSAEAGRLKAKATSAGAGISLAGPSHRRALPPPGNEIGGPDSFQPFIQREAVECNGDWNCFHSNSDIQPQPGRS